MKTKHLMAVLTATTLLAAPAAMAQDTLSFATTNSEGDTITVAFLNDWVERIEATSGGALDIEFRYGGMIANDDNVYDRVVDGVVDMGFNVSVFNPGQWSQTLVATLPLTSESAAEGSETMCRMYEKGAFEETFTDVIPLLWMQFPRSGIGTAEAPVAGMDQMAGLKLITASPGAAGVLGNYDVAPLSLNISETYEALQRGTADGYIYDFMALYAFGLEEQTMHYFDVNMGSPAAMVFISREKFDGLSEAAQEALMAHATCDESAAFGAAIDVIDAASREKFLSLEGRSITPLSDEVVEALRAKHLPGLRNGFGNAFEGGAERMDLYLETLEEVRAANAS